MSVWNHPRATPPILVKTSILENADDLDFLHEIFAFVIDMQSRGHYLPGELPAHAIQFYNVYLYEMEISNGGHSQYIHNTMVREGQDNARENFQVTHAGLISMRARQQADILRRMIAWFDANPQQADEQTGFEGGRDEQLEPLDTEFYDAEEALPIGGLAKTWVLGWADLRPVADAEFDNACNALVLANPKRVRRAAAARIKKFVDAFEPFPVGIALAIAAAKEILVRIGDVHEANIGDERMMAWRLRTDRGVRYAAADQDGISLYEYVELEGQRTSLAVHARSGALLGRVAAEDIDTLMNGVDEWMVAAAADLLLRRARPDAEDAVLSPAGLKRRPNFWLKRLVQSPTDDAQNFYIALNKDIFVLSQSSNGFVLSANNGAETFGPITVQEAEKYRQDMMEQN